MKKFIIAICILGLIVIGAVFVPGVSKFFSAPADMVDAVSTGMEIKQIEAMITGFNQKYERWPTEEEFAELVAENYRKNRDDALDSEGLVDMWGQPYNYFRQGSGFLIISMGPDKKAGTTDDIILLRRK